VVTTHTTEATHVPLFEKREELRRVLDSKYFTNSPKKTRFLEFVSEQTFMGNGDKLNEYLIGVEVYERGVDFNPQKDPIVRVQAYEIRRLLKKILRRGRPEQRAPHGLAFRPLCSDFQPPCRSGTVVRGSARSFNHGNLGIRAASLDSACGVVDSLRDTRRAAHR
jgi:hypothetical protein